MDINTVSNGFIAFIAGVIVSPHCAGMCGPLSCILLKPGLSRQQGTHAQAMYHGARTLAYVIIGSIAGLLGMGLLDLFRLPAVQYFPWFLVIILLGFALGVERYLPKPKLLGRLFTSCTAKLGGLSSRKTALTLGLATPFLPCAPLYSIFWIALLSGSPWFGAELALGFACGTIPLLWLSQRGFTQFQARFGPAAILRLQRVVALLAATALIWRMLSTDGPLQAECCRLLARF